MARKPRPPQYWDDWYAGKAATPAVREVMNRHLGLPPDLLTGIVPADAIAEFISELRLKPGDTLLDLACGWAGVGLTVALDSGAGFTGVDVSAEALAAARAQAARLGVVEARFSVGDLTASGLPDSSADAVLCTDAIQFPDDPSAAYREIRRVLKPAGRVALTCWEPVDRNDQRLPDRIRHVDLAAGLAEAGFTGIEVHDRQAWLELEHAIWEEAVTIDPGDDPALVSFHDEGVRSLEIFPLIRRVLAVATAP